MATLLLYLYVWLQHTGPPRLRLVMELPHFHLYVQRISPTETRDSVGGKVRRDGGNPQDLDKLRFDDPVIDVRSLLAGLGGDMDVTAVLFC